ncbi:MAG: GTPase Era involved in 16S rRNA processing [Bradymonadia bacterium]|jgi:GTPase Era involved in 16S rRNA processing
MFEMNSEKLTEQVADTLRELADLAANAGMTTIAKEIREERLPAVLEGKMTMVVLGEFNHGKSTAINALLQLDTLPTGITPTTSVITHIMKGDGDVRLITQDGVIEVPKAEFGEHVTEDGADNLRYVEIEVESPFLFDGLILVDTPGVNDISKQRVEITYGYVPRADVIVYVLDSTQALKRSEIQFIQSRLIKNQHDRVFFLLGKTDALSPDEVEEIVEHVRSKLDRIMGEDMPVFPVSARKAMKGQDPGFDLFRDAVSKYLHEQRAEIVLEGGIRTGLRLASVVDQSLAIEETALTLESDELARRIESVRGRLDKSRSMISENVELIEKRTAEILAATRDNVATFTRDFSAALPREIERSSADDVKRFLPDFIHDTFKDWLEAEGTHVAMKLELLAEEIITITNRNANEAMSEVLNELGARSRDLDLDVDTFGYDIGVFALGAIGVTVAFSNLVVGGLLTLAAPVLAFALKGKVESVIRERATEQGLSAVSNAAKKVEEEFDRIVNEFASRLTQFVEDSGDRLYRQVADALDRVVASRQRHNTDNGELGEELVAVRAQVSELKEKFATAARELAPAEEATSV